MRIIRLMPIEIDVYNRYHAPYTSKCKAIERCAPVDVFDAAAVAVVFIDLFM
jgi:hypothetical protein